MMARVLLRMHQQVRFFITVEGNGDPGEVSILAPETCTDEEVMWIARSWSWPSTDPDLNALLGPVTPDAHTRLRIPPEYRLSMGPGSRP
jgi:hypothetical protein